MFILQYLFRRFKAGRPRARAHAKEAPLSRRVPASPYRGNLHRGKAYRISKMRLAPVVVEVADEDLDDDVYAEVYQTPRPDSRPVARPHWRTPPPEKSPVALRVLSRLTPREHDPHTSP